MYSETYDKKNKVSQKQKKWTKALNSLFTKALQMTGGLPWCPVVKNLPCNVEDAGSSSGWERKSLHATEQLVVCCSF